MKTTLHPLHNVYDGMFNANSGNIINLNAPTPQMITIEDIARGLSNICRFGGQIHTFYSVAQHTLLVWHLAPTELKRAALLHDAAEAYLGDVIKPLKVMLGETYAILEARFESVIFKKFGVELTDLDRIKKYDKQAVELEHAYFRVGNIALIEHQAEIDEIFSWRKTPYDRLLSILLKEFVHTHLNNTNL